jgi:ketosteroid isomerase-like protein
MDSPKDATEMKRLLATAAIALSITTAAQAANNVTTLFARNYWVVTHMAHSNEGKPMCLMTSQISFGTSLLNSGNAYVRIKWEKGRSSPFIQLDKMNWHFPQDMQVPYTINFDNGHRDFVGVSKIHPAIGITVLLTGAMEDGNAFLDDFSHSETMTINFDNGNEPKWNVKMAGSRDATKAFRSCVKGLGEEDKPQATTSPVPQTPTSPVPDDASSQPAPTAAADADLKQEVEKISSAYMESFNKQDAAGIAALYATGGVLVTPRGPHADIAEFYQGVFKAGLDHDEGTIDQVWPLGSDAVLAMGEYRITGRNQGGAPLEVGRWTAVYVRESGKLKVRMLSAFPKAAAPPKD